MMLIVEQYYDVLEIISSWIVIQNFSEINKYILRIERYYTYFVQYF